MRTQRRAFTLVELLVVVGIISILASIAVPNFLEAQTRAKTSRVKTDLRTITVALESYMLDNNRYPLVADLEGNTIDPYPGSGPYLMGTTVGIGVTTPIAYMSSRPPEVFQSDSSKRVPYRYITRDYSTAKRGMFGVWYFDDYVECVVSSPRAYTAYALVSNGPDLDDDILSRPET